MEKDEFGYWSCKQAGVSFPSSYKFLIDGRPFPDPASRSQPEGVHGHSFLLEDSFAWTDDEWKGIALHDMIIYELHVGAFSSSGTFEGVIDRLDYLLELGVNTIELMPVSQFPGERNWGYDGVFPFAVQHSYGGAEGLKNLVNAAHAKGIAVLLDVVYNHLGPEGNYLGEYGPYFTDKYRSFWGKSLNYDDAYAYGVRSFFLQNALYWLDTCHLDGLRLDAVHAIHDESAVHFMEELKMAVEEVEQRTQKKKVLIAELDLNQPRYIKKREEGGYGLDGQWVDEFHHALHAVLTGEIDGYYEDFGTVAHIEKSLRDGYVYTGQFSAHRKRNFGAFPHGINPRQFVVFAQNHDQIGNRLLGDRLAAQLDLEGLKLAASAVILSPFVPLLFMGEEYGETKPFQYFISHTDKKLVEQVREGRKKEFAYFNWKGEVPDPQAEETFREGQLDERIARRDNPLFKFYRALIEFRKHHLSGTSIRCEVFPTQGFCVSYSLSSDETTVLIILNFSKEAFAYAFPKEVGKELINSALASWGGPIEKSASIEKDGRIRVQAHSVQVYQLL